VQLYVTGTTPNSHRARVNLAAALNEIKLPPECAVEIIDVLVDAKSAISAGVIVTPCLIASGLDRRLVMIGDLSDSQKLHILLKTVAAWS
jgi:hypothetical protein